MPFPEPGLSTQTTKKSSLVSRFCFVYSRIYVKKIYLATFGDIFGHVRDHASGNAVIKLSMAKDFFSFPKMGSGISKNVKRQIMRNLCVQIGEIQLSTLTAH